MLDGSLDVTFYLSQRKDPFPGIKALLSYPLCNWVNEYFLTTREYEKGLRFVEYASSIINANRYQISVLEYEKWDKQLIIKELVMLDYLNRWEEYIEHFNNVLATKFYEVIYSMDFRPYIRDKYVLSENDNYVKAHFLCFLDDRYNISCRKLARKNAGKTTSHLRRHHRFMLSDEEVKKRFETIINRLEVVLRNNKTPP